MTAKIIEKLTAEQEKQLIQFRSEMWARGTSCAPTDREVAERAITEAYATVGRPAPRFFWMSSPMTSALAFHVLRKVADDVNLQDGLWAGLQDGLQDGLRDGLQDGLQDGLRDGLRAGLSTYWWGQMDTYWIALYRFGSMIGCAQKADLLRRLDIMERVATSCGFWWPRDGICIVSDRFASVAFDESRNAAGLPFRLHRADGPAIAFRDGWGCYYWHGLRIPLSHQWIISDRAQLTAGKIDSEHNAELRRVMLEIFGFERYLGERQARLVAEDDLHGFPRRLYEVRIGGEAIRVIEVVNGSLEPDGSRRRFHLGAMRGETPHDLIAASYGIAPKHYREAVRS